MKRSLQRWLVGGCLLAAAGFAAAAGGIHLKAWLAQHLIARAWAQTVADGEPAKPWPWADTWPVASLRWDGDVRPLYVLSPAGGEALAFGPSLVPGSYPPGSEGTIIIGGHRDTHFSALANLRVGERLYLSDTRGAEAAYEVTSARVADIRTSQLQAVDDSGQLVLVTCYPFDAVQPGGPLRYVIVAQRL